MSAKTIAKRMPHPYERDTAVVFITDRRTFSMDAESLVPEGFRLASPEEIASRWEASSEFRDRLCDTNILVWTSQIGLSSSGLYEIRDGNFTEVTEYQYRNLEPKNRSRHYPGDGRVTVFSRGERLGVMAGLPANVLAYVAYISTDGCASESDSTTEELTALIRNTD